MPKAAAYRLSWNYVQGTYTLHDTRNEQALPLVIDTPAWFDWLARTPSFTFSGQQGHLTVRQETRAGGAYWYAYQRVGPKMAKRYLGRATELTRARLEHVAAELSTAALPSGEETPASGVSSAARFTPEPQTSPLASLKSTSRIQDAMLPLPHRLHGLHQITGFHAPHLRPALVRRPRLIERLQQGMQARLILVSAPAGFGKTTLLAQWLAHSQRPSAWISLEPADNDAMRFLSTLIGALQQFDHELGTHALASLHPSPPSPPPSPSAVVMLVLRDLHRQADRDLVLVLDDYEVITNQQLHQALTTLVEQAPAHLHLVLATRTDPAFPLARLRARGQLCEVRAAQMQFLLEETSTFLHTVMGLDLSPEACALLQERTEGWIVGLQLAGLSLQGRSDVQQFLGAFTGSHRHIVDYLTEEVLAHQSEATQSFLLRTALFDRFTASLCDAVTGRNDAEAVLSSLERANVFLIPLDEHRLWYRYHHLFAEVLRARVRRLVGTAELAAMYTRASVWYEQNAMPAEAVEAALEARDFARAGRFIDINAPFVRSMLLGYEARTLIGWLERFPQEVVFANAGLCLVSAFSQGVAETSLAYEGPLALAEQLFHREDNRRGLGQAWTLRALMAGLRGDALEAARHGTAAFEVLPKDALVERGLVASALVESYRLRGEVMAARRLISEVRPLHEQGGDSASLLANTIVLGDLLIMQGRLNAAAELYGEALKAAGQRQSFAIRALVGLSKIAHERNELDAAEEYLDQAMTIAEEIQDQVMLAHAALLHARVLQTRQDAERTREAWAHALSVTQACGYVGLVEQAQAYQVRGWLQQGQIDEASRWRSLCPLSDKTPPNYQQEVLALTLVRVLLAQGETKAASGLVERWHGHARTQGRTGSEMEWLVLSALIAARQGKAEQAVQQLQQALLLARPEAYVRVFVDEGVPMGVLLHMVLSRWKGKRGAEYVHHLLAVLQAELPPPAPHARSAPLEEAPFEPLTDRERTVLRGLAAGLSNAEIAASQVVSITTVKTQARSIYRKLNVKNRHEAVVTAQSWKLL